MKGFVVARKLPFGVPTVLSPTVPGHGTGPRWRGFGVVLSPVRAGPSIPARGGQRAAVGVMRTRAKAFRVLSSSVETSRRATHASR
ncbi:MAG: hypothetical protein IPG23_28695 [Burkholderiales bacterium]|nr:hypothetical protein [Burkholderiales bacterium]